VGFFRLQRLDEDALDAAHVDEVDVEGLAAGVIEALGGVALAEADELEALAHLRPRPGAVEETLGEDGHCGTVLCCAALDAIRRPQRVGGQLSGVIGGVGGTAAARLPWMDLDQPAPVIDAHQLAVLADLHLLTRRAEG